MPAFQLPERTITLVFETGPLVGLELEVRLGLPLDTYFELNELVSAAADKKTGLEPVRTLHRRFAELALVGWNLLDRDGQPVPPTPEAFTATINPKDGWAMVTRYLLVLSGKLGPLAPGSGSGPMLSERSARPRRRRSPGL